MNHIHSKAEKNLGLVHRINITKVIDAFIEVVLFPLGRMTSGAKTAL